MTQEQLMTELVGTKTLDLVVTIKDTSESKVTAKFITLTFENSSQVAMKLEITTINKDITINQSGETLDMEPVVFSKIIRADERTQVPVVDENGDPILDDEEEPLTIPENLYWKYLCWEKPLGIPFKAILDNVIKVKFNLISNNVALQVNRADIGLV